MNDLATQSTNLPANIEDLAKFVLVGRERLTAVRAEIRAIQKVGLAKEVHEQKLAEAQDIAEAVLDAEAKIGELTKAIPKADHDRGNQYTGGKSTPLSSSQKPKSQALEEIGITQKTAERFERIAAHPKAVEAAKEQAREEGRIVTRQDVLNRIPAARPKPMSMDDTIDLARGEREAYKQDKQESVVNIADAQRDAENKELIANETLLKVMKSANHASDVIVLSLEELDEMIETISDQQFEGLHMAVRQGIKALTKIQVRMEVKRCKKTDKTDFMHCSPKKSDGEKILTFTS